MKWFYKIIFSVLLFIIFFVSVEAKEIMENVFTERIGEFYSDFVKNDDGEVIAVGAYIFEYYNSTNFGGVITKYDNNGNFLWNIEVNNGFTGFYSVAQLSDGNYVAVGSYSDPPRAMMYIFDDSGNVIYNKIVVENIGYYYLNSVFEDIIVYDDGFVVFGYKQAFLNENSTADREYVAKFDNEGNLVWELNNQFEEPLSEFYSYVKKSNGNFLILGDYYNSSMSSYCNMIVEYDSDGNIINVANDEVFCRKGYSSKSKILLISDDEYILTSYVNSSMNVFYFDTELNLIEKKNYDFSNFLDIERYEDGYFILSSVTCEEDENSSCDLLSYYDSDNNLIYFKKYPVGNSSFFEKITVYNDFIYFSQFFILESGEQLSSKIYEYSSVFTITEEETENGTYEVSREDDKGVIKITPEEGYVLSVIQIFDSNGNEVPYYEEDGVYYFDLVDDVKVNVEYKELVVEEDTPDIPEEVVPEQPKDEVNNPDTKDYLNIGVFILLGLSFILSLFFLRKKVQLR